MKSRRDLFRVLIANENPHLLQENWDSLDVFSWEPDFELDVSLAAQDIVSILQRYLQNALSSQQVEDWANFIEAMSFIHGGIGDDSICDAIHILANPVLEGRLTPARAENMIAQLEGRPPPCPESVFRGVPAPTRRKTRRWFMVRLLVAICMVCVGDYLLHASRRGVDCTSKPDCFASAIRADMRALTGL